MAADRDSNSSHRLVSEVPSSPPPLIAKNQANPSKSCLSFIYKAVFVSIILIILPLFPSTAPEFVNQTITDRSWELVHLLFVGIAVSYGLFCRRNVETDKENHFKNDNTQAYMSRILQVSSVFDDDQIENFSGSDENLVQTWSSEYYRGESTVLVAGENSVFAEHRNFSSNNVSVKPLVLPVRSLRSQISDPDVVETGREEESFESSDFFRSSVSGSNIDRNVNGDNGDLSSVDLDEKFKGNFVLPSPVPWRSRSGRMVMMNEQVNSFVPSVEESEFNEFSSESFPLPNYLSFQPNSTFPPPLKTTSISPEFQFESVNEMVSFQPNSTFPPPLKKPLVSPEFRYENVNETVTFQRNSTFPPLKKPSVSPEFRYENVNEMVSFEPNSTFPPLKKPSVSPEFGFEYVNEMVSFEPNSTFPPQKKPSISPEFRFEDVNEKEKKKKKKKNKISKSSSPPTQSLSPTTSPTRNGFSVNKDRTRSLKDHQKDLNRSSGEDLGLNLSNSEAKSSLTTSLMTSNSEGLDQEKGINKRSFKDQKDLTRRSREDLELHFSNSEASHKSSLLTSGSNPIGEGFSVDDTKRSFKDQKDLTRRSREDLELHFSNSEASNKSSLLTSGSTSIGDGLSAKDTKRSFKDEKDLSRRSREDLGLHVSKSEAKSKTRIESSSKGKSVRTVRKSELVGGTMKNGDQLDEKTGKRSKEVEEVSMEETRKGGGGFSSLSYSNGKPTYESTQPAPNFSKYQKKHKKKLAEKVILETEYSGSEVDEIRGTFDTENAASDTMSDAKSDSNEVDKKADEFIAKFREQIRLQKIETSKRSSNGKHSRNSSR